MHHLLGRPLEEALRSLPEGKDPPQVQITAVPAHNGQARAEGTLRIVACREDQWIAARFMDQAPREKEES